MSIESLQTLISIANCGIRLQHPTEIRYRDVKPHWWSWKTVKEPYEYTPKPEYYQLDESLKAIEALGETGNLRALEFLENLYIPKIECQSERYFVSGGSEPRDDDWKLVITTAVVYPNAQGCLADALSYVVGTEDIYEDDTEENLEVNDYSDQLERGELVPPENNQAHIIIQTAIAKLKRVLEV